MEKKIIFVMLVVTLMLGYSAQGQLVLLQDDFSTLDAAWVQAGTYGWGLDGGAVMSLNEGVSNESLTRQFSQSTSDDWTLDIRYGWKYNGGLSQRDGIEILDAAGDGYSLYIEEGTRAIYLEKYTGYSTYAGGVADSGSKLQDYADALTPLRWTWTATTGEHNVYIGTSGGDFSTLSVLPIITGSDLTTTTFTQIHLRDRDNGGGGAKQSKFDDVLFTTVPEPATMMLLGLGGLGLLRKRRS